MRQVAPLAGAWIETRNRTKSYTANVVAPLAGAWIETLELDSQGRYGAVAPLAGAWIETSRAAWLSACENRRAPRGRVD